MQSRRVLLLSALGLGACGFRPVYRDGRSQFGVALRGDSGREGRNFREAWRRRAGEPGGDPDWALKIALRLSEAGLGVNAEETITRYTVTGVADYTLRRAGEASEVAQGQVRASSAYSTLASPYATRVARRDAERRVAEALAERVFFRLAPTLTGAA